MGELKPLAELAELAVRMKEHFPNAALTLTLDYRATSFLDIRHEGYLVVVEHRAWMGGSASSPVLAATT